MTKLVYLSKLKDAKFQKFLEIDKEVQEIKKKEKNVEMNYINYIKPKI